MILAFVGVSLMFLLWFCVCLCVHFALHNGVLEHELSRMSAGDARNSCLYTDIGYLQLKSI